MLSPGDVGTPKNCRIGRWTLNAGMPVLPEREKLYDWTRNVSVSVPVANVSRPPLSGSGAIHQVSMSYEAAAAAGGREEGGGGEGGG
jgi:hypothetical protein